MGRRENRVRQRDGGRVGREIRWLCEYFGGARSMDMVVESSSMHNIPTSSAFQDLFVWLGTLFVWESIKYTESIPNISDI